MSIDVRDLITLDDVMEEMQLGPNGCAASPAPPPCLSVLPPPSKFMLPVAVALPGGAVQADL